MATSCFSVESVKTEALSEALAEKSFSLTPKPTAEQQRLDAAQAKLLEVGDAMGAELREHNGSDYRITGSLFQACKEFYMAKRGLR